jgi:hypothetical protein
MKYTVIRDSQEQAGWDFSITKYCEGTVVEKLPTGDYTIRGYEEVLTIERKGTTGEFAKNINEGRFERELVRMESFKYPFMVLEFDMDDIYEFPKNSGIPRSKWSNLRVTSFYIAKRLIEFELKYKTKIILAGTHGKDISSSIFKRVIENEQQSA